MSFWEEFKKVLDKGSEKKDLSYNLNSDIQEPGSLLEFEGGIPKGATGYSERPLEAGAGNPEHKAEWAVKSLPVWGKGDLILDTYLVEERKSGNMGYVYIAEHQGWKTKLAIKSPKEDLLGHPNNFRRVLSEAEEWTRLGLHPHIAYCYYVRNIAEIPHIFIEYLEAGNLREWIADKRCKDYRVGLDLAIQFCHGIEYAHNCGIIHRDIKPENILMTRDGTLKITDFGIARGSGTVPENASGASDRDVELLKRHLTGFGAIMGTPHYMAPEQWENPHTVDARADIYSFGVCMYEMFCGRRPYITFSTIAKIDGAAPIEPSRLREGIPEALALILKKCCALDKEERFSDFAQLREALNLLYVELFHEEAPHARLLNADLRADGLNNRALSYLDLGRPEEAAQCWEEAVKTDPFHLASVFNLGHFKWTRGEICSNDYLDQLNSLKKELGGQPEFWLCLGWIYYKQGNVTEFNTINSRVTETFGTDLFQGLNNVEKPVGELLFTLKNSCEVLTVQLSPDGKFAVSGGEDGLICLWDLLNRKKVREFAGHFLDVRSVCFSPNGAYIASGSNDKTVRVWNVSSGEEIHRLGHRAVVRSVSFSPDGTHIVSGSQDGAILLWNATNGEKVRQFSGHSETVTSICFSPDGRLLASASFDTSVRLWDVARGEEYRRFTGHTSYVTTVCYSHDGQKLASGSQDGSIRLWDVHGVIETKVLMANAGMVKSVAFSPKDCHVIAGGIFHTLSLWDIVNGYEIRKFLDHDGAVNAVCWAPDSPLALSGSSDSTIKLWRLVYPIDDGNQTGAYPLISRPETTQMLVDTQTTAENLISKAEACMTENNYHDAYRHLMQSRGLPGYERDSRVMSLIHQCGQAGRGNRLGLNEGWPKLSFEGHRGFVRSVCFTPRADYVLSGSDDQTVRLWDAATGIQIRLFSGHTGAVQTVAVSSDGCLALSGSIDHTIRIWDIVAGRKRGQLLGHTRGVNSVVVSPVGGWALSGSDDTTVRLWDIESCIERMQFQGHKQAVNSVDISPDGRYGLSGGLDTIVCLWDLYEGKKIMVFEGHSDSVHSVRFSPDGSFALSASEDKSIRLWNLSGRDHSILISGQVCSHALDLSPEGSYVLGDQGEKVVLWDRETGIIIKELTGHHYSIDTVCFSPNGRYALSGGRDEIIRLWELDWNWSL